MSSYNKIFLMGNLTRDPELRVTPKGTAICQFGIAINRDYKTESGEKRSEATFVDVEAWGKTGENIHKYFTKGKAIFCEGRLKLDQWEDKNTKEKRSKLKVVLETFQFIGGKDGGDQGAAPASEANLNPPPPRSNLPAKSADNLDEDVPF